MDNNPLIKPIPRSSRPLTVLVFLAVVVATLLLLYRKSDISTTPTIKSLLAVSSVPSLLEDLCLDPSDSSLQETAQRGSYGTHVELPPVHFEEMATEGKTQLASLCLSDEVPLHVAIVLSPVMHEDRVGGAFEHKNIPSLNSQISALTTDSAQSLVKNLLVTAMVELLPPQQAKTRRIAVAYLHYSSSGPATLLGSDVVVIEKSSPLWPRVAEKLFETLNQNKHSVSSDVIHKVQVSQAGAPKLPHFVLALPPDTYVTSANLRGLCYLDAAINDEAEATSVYPFAPEPFVPATRKHERNGRLSVGFLRVVGEQVTLVSSCRPPVVLPAAQRVVEGGHYSKGGDMAMRGPLWSLDVGSALRRNGGNAAVLPPRAVLVPFMAGVHSDVLLATPKGNGPAPPLNNGQRMAVFPLRRKVVDSHCSTDPQDPVRVSTHMVQFVNERLSDMRNGFDVFVRVLNATALMTGFSDLTITTNCAADVLLKYLRAEVRGLDARAFLGDPSLDDSGKGVRFLDKAYPNPLGELVIVTSHRKTAGSWYGLAGNTHFPLLSQLGFHDIVQYTEDDVYLSRDQFELYCATLPFLEAREEFLNQIRWESVWDEIDEGPVAQPATRMHDGYMWRRVQLNVLQSKLPRRVAIPDKRPQEGWSWRTDAYRSGYSINVALRSGQKQKTSDRTRNTVPYPVPKAPLAYDVTTVPIESCRFVGGASTHLKNNTEANVAGCYTLAYAHNSAWGKNRIYNSIWTLPTHRVQNYYLNGLLSKHKENGTESGIGGTYWRGYNHYFNLTDYRYPFNRDCKHQFFRESILYFEYTPLQSYDVGGVFMVYMEEGEGLEAYKDREAGGANADKKQGRYGLHRLSGINHGRNQYPNMDNSDSDVILIQPTFSSEGVLGLVDNDPKPILVKYTEGNKERSRYEYK